MVHGIPPYGSTPPPEQGSIPPADRQKLEQLEQSLANDPSALAQGIKQKIEDYLNGSTPYPANGLKGVFADINQTFFQQ